MVDRMIESSGEAAAASGRYARALNWLTGALVFVGLLQVVTLWWRS